MRGKLLPLGATDKLKSNLVDSKLHEAEEFKDMKDSIKNLTECILQMTQ